jgi:regulator of sirC expression with transglutaminase-like and TPR domain
MIFRLAIVLLFGVVGMGEACPQETALEAMIERLDADEFLVRQHAAFRLIEIGEVALPYLSAVAKGGSLEQRARAHGLVRAIQERRSEKDFRELKRTGHKEFMVERGMVLIAQILDPEVTEEAIAAKLDEVAASVRKSVGDGVDPKSLGGAEVMAAVSAVLKDQYQLSGDTENYDHPDNSSIHRVFEQKDGLPILLSEIAVAVGRRLEVPIVGVAVPQRYMIRYDGARAPAGKPKNDVIVDPYGGWQVTTAAKIRPIWGVDPDGLEASEPEATIERLLNNLESDFLKIGERRRAAEVARYRELFVGSDPAPQAAPGGSR